MKAYADTGFLVSLHAPDVNSSRAQTRMERQDLPLAWTWLHGLEFRNAMHLKIFRKEMAESLVGILLADVGLAIGMGRYRRAVLPDDVNERAEQLSAAWTPLYGSRSLDILHVAYALSLGIDTFLTFDKRQAALARAAGLDVPEL